MAITRLSGGDTPADGADPRTFPAIWNGTADLIEAGDYTPVSTFAYGHVANGTLAMVLNTLYYQPFIFPRTVTISQLSANVSTGGTAGSVVRLGIYLPAASGLPGSLLVDAGTINGTSATVQSISTSQTIGGLVYLAAVAQVAACTMRAVNTVAMPDYFPGVPAASFLNRVVQTETGVTGALPATAASSLATSNNGIAMRVTIA